LRRREFISLLGGTAAALPIVARAQQGRLPVVGVLRSNPKDAEAFAEPFRRYMKAIGWEEGRNIRFLFVWAEGRNERAPALAGELVAKNVDLIITFGDPAIHAAQRATQTIPIVGMTDDMIGSGLAVSMARPGGNTTGVSILTLELDVKRLEILHEFLPQARRIAVLADPSTISTRAQLTSAARDLALELVRFEAQSPDEIGNALDALASAKVDAVNVLASPILNAAHRLIIERMHNARLPTIYQFPESAEDGGLLAYGPRVLESYRRIVYFVDRILKGAKPADLPIEQPTKFELVVNLKTASALSLTIPPALLARADEVIE
jgi:putative tryptophan/tyrosine transport system substrate-binding protein